MVATRSGRRTGRYEDQRERLRLYNNSMHSSSFNNYEYYLNEINNEDMNLNEDNFYEPNNTVAGYHIGHPHEHPGYYRDRDENHRHRFGRPNRNDEWIPGHYRRKPLF